MAKLKHVGIATRDPDKAVKFFTDVLGWKIAGEIDSRNATGYYVSDGSMNIALLKFKNAPAAGSEYGPRLHRTPSPRLPGRRSR